MKRGYLVKEDTIIIERSLTKLDKFVKEFLDVLKKHSDYLIVSGFVSIATGRTRGTEDVDILVPIMDKIKFQELYKDLQKKFWCYQGETSDELYNYIQNKESLRFAKKNEMFPNMEFVPIDQSRKLKFFEFSNPQKIKIKNFEFKIPPLEFEILYKELILKGEKDLADAKHLRTFFSEIIKEENFMKYKEVILENGNQN